MTIHPQHDRILVKRDDAEGITRGGIILPDQTQEKPQRGVIVAVGPGKRIACAVHPRGYVQPPIEFNVGQRVIFTKYAGEGIKVGGEEVFLVKEEDVVAVIQLDEERQLAPGQRLQLTDEEEAREHAQQLESQSSRERAAVLAGRFKAPTGVHG